MKSIRNIVWVVTGILLFASCNSDKSSGAKKAEVKSDSTEKVYPVKIQEIQKQTVSHTLDYTANLTAFKEIYYAPASPGRIDKIHVDVGSRIVKGQLLIEMDRTQLNQARTQYENMKTNFQRIDTLHQLGSTSEQQYEQMKTQYEIAESSYEFLLENTTLKSPIDGIVTGKYFENGELYSGAPNTMAGKAAILTLMQINTLKTIVSISQTYYPKMKKGMKADIAIDIFPGKVFHGLVYKVYPTIEASTRTFKTEIIIENASEILRPGMFGTIKIKLKDIEALVVPSVSVLKQEGTNNRYVFVNDNNTAKQVMVTLGKRYDDQLEIIATEITEGDDLVIEGQANLLDGSKINIVE